MVWLDRKIFKEVLFFLLQKENYVTLNIPDAREIEDVDYYIKSNFEKDHHIAYAVLNSSIVAKKFNMLQSLVDDLSLKVKFNRYFDKVNFFEESNLINIQLNQEIGTHIKANNVTISDVIQYPIHMERQLLKFNLKEENINTILDAFISDLNNYGGNYPFLFIIKFLERGYSELDSEFKHWFKEVFIKKIQSTVIVVILDQGKPDIRLKSNGHIDINETIAFSDLYDFLKTFMRTTFPSSNQIDIKLLTAMLSASDGLENHNVKYGDASRTFHIFCKYANIATVENYNLNMKNTSEHSYI